MVDFEKIHLNQINCVLQLLANVKKSGLGLFGEAL